MDLMEKLNVLEARVGRLVESCGLQKARIAVLEEENLLLKNQVLEEKKKASTSAADAAALRRDLDSERASAEALKKRVEKMLRELDEVPDEGDETEFPAESPESAPVVRLSEGEVLEIDLDSEEEEEIPDEEALPDDEEVEDPDGEDPLFPEESAPPVKSGGDDLI